VARLKSTNNERLNKVKINKLKTCRELGVIIKDGFKTKIRAKLNLKLESLAQSCVDVLAFWSLMTSYVKSMCFMCRTLVRRIVVQKKSKYFGFCWIEPFLKCIHFLFNPPMPHFTCTLKHASILFVGSHYNMVNIWHQLLLPYLVHNKFPYPYSLDFPRGIQNIHSHGWSIDVNLYKHFNIIKCSHHGKN